jgi:MarR family transcriptional regulator, organic hydroperoxide resistance regulator
MISSIMRAMSDHDVRRLLEHYPRIYFACHSRHVRDPRTRTVLSAHQASILDHLDEVEPTSLMDLAKHMGVTASTMSIAIERLARHGYVIRNRHPGDGRRVNLTLSAAGVRIRDAQSVLDPHRVRAMLDRLSARDRRHALDGLALLARAAREAMHALAPAGRARGSSRTTRRHTA